MEHPFDYLCSLLRDGEYTIEIKRRKKRRSISQNNLYWMWCQCIADSMNEENGENTSSEDIHEILRRKFLMSTKVINGVTTPMPRSTTQLSTEEFTVYLEKIQAYMATEWHITLPLPQDRYYELFINQYGKE